MANPFFSSCRRRVARRRAGFTLIELLAVMAIIVVLAGLILGVASHANYKGSLTRAEAEVKALSSAVENYKIDNGTYPRNSNTDSLVAQRDFDPVGNNNLYKLSAEYLYQELSGVHPTTSGSNGSSNNNNGLTKAYYTFQPNQIDLAPDAPTSVTTRTPTSPYMFAADPFGFAYGYSTAYQKALDDANNQPTPGATPTPDQGYNPTFDLWCTAGYSVSSGKGTPANRANASPAAIYSTLWIKNW